VFPGAWIAVLVDQLGNIAKPQRCADPQDKAAIYHALGLRLSFNPEEQKVRAETGSDAPIGWNVVSEKGHAPLPHH
jgi:hypothetical protein